MFESEGKILKYGHSNESHLEAFSCGAGYYAVQGIIITFDSVGEILKCDHSNERY